MQYLLDEAEMAEIRRERKTLNELPGGADHIIGLKNVCQYVATQIAEVGSNLANGRKPSTDPHGCIHVKQGYGIGEAMYCDRCPVSGICPQPKNWSK